MARPRNAGIVTPSLANWLAAAAIAAVVFVAFIPALRGEFLSWDDFENFVTNRSFRGIGATQLSWAWSTRLLGHYVPLSWMSLGVDFSLWGMDPFGYHLTNILIHATNAILLFLIAARLVRLGSPKMDAVTVRLVAAVSALLFAVHPLRVESVAWITERRDVLSLFFVFAATLSWLRAAGPDAGRRWYPMTLVLFGAALLAKASAVTVPAAWLILEVYPLRRIGGVQGWWNASTRRVAARLIPFFGLAAAASVMSMIALEPGPQLEVPAKIAVTAYSFAFYLFKTLAPVNLAALYPMPHSVNALAPIYLASYLTVALVLVGLWLARKKSPATVAAILVFSALVFPLLGVVQNGPQIAADRYTYLASAPLAIIAALAMFRLPRRVAAIGASVIVLALVTGTWNQCKYWQTSERLWARVLEVDSTSSYAHNNLGIELAVRGQTEGAMAHYRRAIAIDSVYPDPHNNLGFELLQVGEIVSAEKEFRAAIKLRASFADAEVNLGNALSSQGNYREGISHYARALTLRPNLPGANFNMGLALAADGDLPAAKAQLERTIQLAPEMTEARSLYNDVVRSLKRVQSGTVTGPEPESNFR